MRLTVTKTDKSRQKLCKSSDKFDDDMIYFYKVYSIKTLTLGNVPLCKDLKPIYCAGGQISRFISLCCSKSGSMRLFLSCHRMIRIHSSANNIVHSLLFPK